jgi:dTDP-4-amino-4,6-dideoxygalactose transaminase
MAAETQIPLVDLRSQAQRLRQEILPALEKAYLRADYVLGEEVEVFEKKFAAFCRASGCVSVANGTDAIHLACRVAGVGPGDEVLIPAMTFVATALGISLAGARPRLVDVDEKTCLMNEELVDHAMTPQTKALMPVHLFGQCVSPSRFRNLAQRHQVLLMEDAAQAHGASRDGCWAGSIGELAGFSFYPGKNLGAYGDGGAITFRDPSYREKLALLRNWGSLKKYHHEQMGLNSRLDTLQAAVLLIKLKHLEEWNRARQALAAIYDRSLSEIPEIRLTATCPGSVYHLYVIRCEKRDELLKHLQGNGIGAGIHYPFPVHLLGAYKWLGYHPGAFPVAEKWARTCISLPMFPEMQEEQVQMVVKSIKSFLARA